MTSEKRRLKFRQELSTLYLPKYDLLCQKLLAEWGPYQGLRSFDYQEVLWRQGRQTPGSIVTNAKAGRSAHNYGCATDWCLWDDRGKPFWPDADSILWKPYQLAIEEVGLKKIENDMPHNELKLNCSWDMIHLAYQQGGMIAAQQKIEVSRI